MSWLIIKSKEWVDVIPGTIVGEQHEISPNHTYGGDCMCSPEKDWNYPHDIPMWCHRDLLDEAMATGGVLLAVSQNKQIK